MFLTIGCGKQPNGPAKPVATEIGKSPTSDVAATVNGEPLALPDYYQHMGLKQTAQVMTNHGGTEMRVLGNFGLQALQEMVDQKVLLQMAKEQGVLPTEAEVSAEEKFQTELRPNYMSVLQDQGLTPEIIQNELMVGLAREHLIMKGVTVSDTEIEKYIKDNPKKFNAKGLPPTVAQRELVRRGIALDKGRVKNDFDRKFLERLRAAKVDVSVPYLKESWAKAWNQLSSSSSAPAPVSK